MKIKEYLEQVDIIKGKACNEIKLLIKSALESEKERFDINDEVIESVVENFDNYLDKQTKIILNSNKLKSIQNCDGEFIINNEFCYCPIDMDNIEEFLDDYHVVYENFIIKEGKNLYIIYASDDEENDFYFSIDIFDFEDESLIEDFKDFILNVNFEN